MSAGWVAGSVRARAIARRRVGDAGARELARAGSFAEAVDMLARSPYGRRVHPGATLPTAARAVAATLLWHVRVLAGWLPASGADMLRLLASWFEIANIEEHLRALAGLPAQPPFSLGTLATAWPRIAATTSRDDLRMALASSPWGDPGSPAPRDIQLTTRMVWAERVAARIPTARAWALGGAALLVAREQLARRETLPEMAAAIAGRLLGRHVALASSVEDLRAALPASARWALTDVTDEAQLWQAEAHWWHRLRTDSAALIAGSGFGPDRIVGAVGLLAVDAWLVVGALEIVARGPEALELFDALA